MLQFSGGTPPSAAGLGVGAKRAVLCHARGSQSVALRATGDHQSDEVPAVWTPGDVCRNHKVALPGVGACRVMKKRQPLGFESSARLSMAANPLKPDKPPAVGGEVGGSKAAACLLPLDGKATTFHPRRPSAGTIQSSLMNPVPWIAVGCPPLCLVHPLIGACCSTSNRRQPPPHTYCLPGFTSRKPRLPMNLANSPWSRYRLDSLSPKSVTCQNASAAARIIS